MPGPSLGSNLHAVVDWTTAFPFLDHFRTSRPWYTQSDEAFDTGHAALLDLDGAGWVRGFTMDGSAAPFDRVSTLLFTGGLIPGGTYVLDWAGQGEVSLEFIPQDTIIRQSDTSLTFTLPEGATLQVSIRSTDPGNTGDYLRDIRLYNEQDRELVAMGQDFTPEFVERLSQFRLLRFMDWMNTNNSPISDWADHRPDDAARESNFGADQRGVSVETMVRLANATRTDAWFTLPHLATDEYIRAFATQVRDLLAPGLVARFELSNEVWNWMFTQSHHAQSQAETLWGTDVEGGWMQWYGMRAAQMARIVEEVFGAETGSRALNVFATQVGWPGLETYALDAPALVAGGGSAPRNAPFHIYAIAPYFGGGIGSEDMAEQVDQWAALGEAGFLAAIDWIRTGPSADSLANIADWLVYHGAVADALGWQLEAYEGGQHVVDWSSLAGGPNNAAGTAFFVDLVKRPEFREMYQEYFEIWRANGGGLMAHFSDFGAGGPYGSWGLWDSPFAPDTPRGDAVLGFLGSVPAWWDDPRPASTFETGLIRVDREGTDRMTGGGGDDLLSALGGNNDVRAGGGNDTIFARDGADTLLGEAGNDLIFGGGGRDRLFGGDGADTLQGGDGRDVLKGGRGRDDLHGGRNADILFGGTGNDRLDGGASNDTLIGGLGADVLIGGTGADVFVFQTLADSAMGRADTIADFVRGQDLIDLSELGLTNLRWRGAQGFTKEGQPELRIIPTADALRLRLDADGDGVADMEIRLVGLTDLAEADFIW